MSLFHLKTVIIGDHGVGKSCIAVRACQGVFDNNVSATIGGATYTLRIKDLKDNTVEFAIWDTAGQERFRNLVPLYFQNVDIAIIVYDITDQSSFDHINDWEQIVKSYAPTDIDKILVGNKSDIISNRAITYERGLQMSTNIGATAFFEASAMNGSGVIEIFEMLANHAHSKTKEEAVIRKTNERITTEAEPKKFCC